jgi:hypothetical protein
MRSESEELMSEQKALHWLVVGYVSPGAEEWIKEAGGRVDHISSEPPLVAVALAYDPHGAWTWSRGRQEHRQGIEFWSTGEIQEASTGITLLYGNSIDKRTLAEYCSVETNYLILPDEEFDTETRQAIVPVVDSEPLAAVTEGDLLELDDHPF